MKETRRRQGRRRGYCTVISLIAILNLVGTANAAHADNWGATDNCGYLRNTSEALYRVNCVSFGNNNQHAVRVYQLGDWVGLDEAVNNGISNADADLSSVHIYKSSTDDLPDVRASDSYYGDLGPFAWVDCPENNTGVGSRFIQGINSRWCRGQYARFNATIQGRYDGKVYAMVAHELGHTIGLRHRDDQAGFMESEDPLGTSFTAHDQGHMNSAY